MKVWKFKAQKRVESTGEWWTALSRRTAKDLRRSFREEDVGIVLLERVTIIEETPHKQKGMRVIRIRIDYPREQFERFLVDTCLTELGIGLIDPVESDQTK